jgi:hypothetical protein
LININTEFIEDEKICILCKNETFQIDGLLQFKNIEQFLCYLKFALIFRQNLLKLNDTYYKENLIEIFDFIDLFNEKVKVNYDLNFAKTKFVCKICLIEYLNKKNALWRILYIIKEENMVRRQKDDKGFANNEIYNLDNNNNKDTEKISLKKKVMDKGKYIELYLINFFKFINIFNIFR